MSVIVITLWSCDASLLGQQRNQNTEPPINENFRPMLSIQNASTIVTTILRLSEQAFTGHHLETKSKRLNSKLYRRFTLVQETHLLTVHPFAQWADKMACPLPHHLWKRCEYPQCYAPITYAMTIPPRVSFFKRYAEARGTFRRMIPISDETAHIPHALPSSRLYILLDGQNWALVSVPPVVYECVTWAPSWATDFNPAWTVPHIRHQSSPVRCWHLHHSKVARPQGYLDDF